MRSVRSIRTTLLCLFMLSATCGTPHAAVELKPSLLGLGFLIGSWTSDDGNVPETGQTSRGSSVITAEIDGAAILRRDHTDLYNKDGTSADRFDQIMLIYPENGTLHADYSDGTHVIHYVKADIVPDRSIVFTSATQAGAPIYRLTYELSSLDTLTLRFEIEPPGATGFRPIATGTLQRAK